MLKVKFMKYFYIIYYSFKQASIYRANNIIKVFSSIIFLYITYYIWMAIYSSNGGYDKSQMNQTLTYVVIITIINQILSLNTEMEIGNKVISGNITVDFVRPISFIKYIFFNRIGILGLNIILFIIPLLLTAIFVLRVNFTFDFSASGLFIISLILSFLLIYLFEFMVGLVSFFTSQIFGVSLLKSSFINILAGLTIPINFYPEQLQNLLMNLPFQAMFYIPLSICLKLPYKTNLFQNIILYAGISDIYIGLIIEQLIWLLIFGLITGMFWQTAKRKLIIQGG